MQKELQMAQDVQISLIPKSTPQIQGWEFAACWKPAHEVSGDFYDFIPLPSGKFGLVVADVSGKGMPAALFMALSRSIIRSVVGQNGMPSEDIIKVNRLIQRDAAQGMFITLFYAEIDPKTNTLTYINAGHNPPMLLGKTNGTVHYLERTGMAAGVEEDSRYEQVTLDFLPGDTLLIYTDGVIDVDQDGGAFGVEKLEKSFMGNCGLSVSDLIRNLEFNLCNLTNQEDLLDDVTILAARRTS